MKYTLYRKKGRKGDEVVVGRSFVLLVWVILVFVLILLGHPFAAFLHSP